MQNNPSNEKAACGGTNTQAAQENAHTDITPDQKRPATVIAQMALIGHSVHKLETGFLVSRWGMTKVCPDFASLVGFARQIGVKQ